MKTKKLVWLLLFVFATATVSLSFTSCKDPGPDGPDGPDGPGPGPGPGPNPSAMLPDSIMNGSDFYCIYMSEGMTAELGSKVKVPTMMRDYDIWPAGETLVFTDRMGINAYGFPDAWISADAAGDLGWNGGGIIALVDQFENVPDLSVLDASYTFHIAMKSPTNQPTAGLSISLNSEGSEVGFYFGPQANAGTRIWGGNYPHDGEWHHFEIPMSQILAKGYLWTGPLTGPSAESVRRYLLSFMATPHMVGAEINLDAIFFYKKPAK